MDATRGRSRKACSRSPPSSSRRPSTRSTTRVPRVAKAVPMDEHLEKSLREAVGRACSTPASSWLTCKGTQSHVDCARPAEIQSSITPPLSRQGTPEVADQGLFGLGKTDPVETTLRRDERLYPTPPGKHFASGTLRECCCHSQTNVSSLEALHQLKDVLIAREGGYFVESRYMEHHPSLEARMRRILFDWLMEVCEVMVLRRETFHLAINLFDRYMSVKRDIRKEQLQLIGVTCLFIAGKLEEIYPPKASAFAYVTDHILEGEIRAMELEILVSVHFRLNAVTANTWAAVWILYMHTADADATSEYDARLFVRLMELVDLAVCDVASLQFSNCMLALASYYLVTSDWSLPESLGFRYADVRQCAEWLTSYFAVMSKYGSDTQVRSYDEVPENEALNIQDHKYTLEDFIAGRDGPKLPLNAPAEVQCRRALLLPRSLSYCRPVSPGFLTPIDQLSEEI